MIFADSWPPHRIRLTSDGRRVLATGGKHSLSIWDVEEGKLKLELDGHKGAVWGLAVSSDDQWALTGADDQVVILWDLVNGKEHKRFPGGILKGQVIGLAFLPNNQAIGTGGNDVLVWSLETGEVVHRLEGHKGQTWTLTVSRDGKKALSSGRDETVRL